VRSQALLILAIPEHAPRADQLGLAIRAMSRSAAASAPISPGSRSTTACSGAASAGSRSGAASACTHASRMRRQREAEKQDSARKRVSESVSLLATKLKQGVHGNVP
jgi:hypothetical protein